MAGVLREAGYEIVVEADSADLLILNTCTVKDKTMRTFRRRLTRLSNPVAGHPERPVVVAGCIPKAQPGASFLKNYPLLGPDAVGRVHEVVRDALRGSSSRILDSDDSRKRNALPIIRRNPAIEILPIARGCRSACTFCQTRLARGRLISFPIKEILAQAQRALDEGVRIFWVTGQDTGAYGHDNDTTLDELMRALLELPGDFQVRLGMSSPQWIVERLDQIISLYHDPKMFKFLHVPLQSGSDQVLRHMKRDGGVDDFRRIHASFRSQFPNGSFVTDLIAGYPTETESDFEQTLALVHDLELGLINVSKFSPRPGTAAARLPMLPEDVIKRRAAKLLASSQDITGQYLQKFIGTEMNLVIEQRISDRIAIGRSEAFQPVHVRTDAVLGTNILAMVTGSEKFHLLGDEMAQPTSKKGAYNESV